MSVIAGAFIAFVVFGIAVPSKADAACGHYARSKNESKAGATLLKLDILAGDPESQSGPLELPAPCNCSGPSCSESPARPDAPIPPTSPLTGERWLSVSIFTDLAPLDGFRLGIPESSPRLVNRPGTIERPPRLLPA